MAYNIGRVREVAVRAATARLPRRAPCGRRDKDHLSERPKACSRGHSVICSGCSFGYLNRDLILPHVYVSTAMGKFPSIMRVASSIVAFG